MMEIKLTDKQFEQLQANLIQDALKTMSNVPKFIDIKSEHIVIHRPDVNTNQISIPIDKITLLINLERENRVFTEIHFNNNSVIDIIVVNLTIDEIKKMIRDA